MRAIPARPAARRPARARAIAALLAALLLGAAAPAALAQSSDQVRLTAPLLEGFLAAYPELAALERDLEARYGDRAEEAGRDPVEALPAYQSIEDARTRTGAVLARHGLGGLDQFLSVYTSALVAYPYADPNGPAPPDVAHEKAEAAAAIQRDATLTPDAKAAALGQLDDQYATLFDSVPLPGNVEAVRPYAERIKAIADRP